MAYQDFTVSRGIYANALSWFSAIAIPCFILLSITLRSVIFYSNLPLMVVVGVIAGFSLIARSVLPRVVPVSL